MLPLRFISQTLKINRRGNYKGFAECAENSTAAPEITKPAEKRKSLSLELSYAAIGCAVRRRSRPSTEFQSILEKNASIYFGRSAGL